MSSLSEKIPGKRITENVVVYLWLERVHMSLPTLVKQKYGAELYNRTLASIKPEISQALNSMLEELSSGDNSRISRLLAPVQVPGAPPDFRVRYFDRTALV